MQIPEFIKWNGKKVYTRAYEIGLSMILGVATPVYLSLPALQQYMVDTLRMEHIVEVDKTLGAKVSGSNESNDNLRRVLDKMVREEIRRRNMGNPNLDQLMDKAIKKTNR